MWIARLAAARSRTVDRAWRGRPCPPCSRAVRRATIALRNACLIVPTIIIDDFRRLPLWIGLSSACSSFVGSRRFDQGALGLSPDDHQGLEGHQMTLANFPWSRGVIVVVASWNGTIVGGVSGPGPVGGGAGSESPLDPGGVTVPFMSFGP